jgi:hypothetical protein
VVAETKIRYWRTILSPSWIFAVLASFFGYWTFTLAMSWGPAYFQNVLGFSGQQAGTMIALPAAWGTIATVALSALTQRLHLKGVPTRKARGWVLGAAGTFAGACLVGATMTTSPSCPSPSWSSASAPHLHSSPSPTWSWQSRPHRPARRQPLHRQRVSSTTGGVFAPAAPDS